MMQYISLILPGNPLYKSNKIENFNKFKVYFFIVYTKFNYFLDFAFPAFFDIARFLF